MMDDSATDDGPTPLVEEQNTAAYSLNEVAANANEPETGLYDEDSEGEKADGYGNHRSADRAR